MTTVKTVSTLFLESAIVVGAILSVTAIFGFGKDLARPAQYLGFASGVVLFVANPYKDTNP